MRGYCPTCSLYVVCEESIINSQLSPFYNKETQQVREAAWDHMVIK